MRLIWVILRHLLEDRKEVAADRRCDCPLQDLAQRFLLGMHVGGQPQRCASVIIGAVSSVVYEGAAPERPSKARHAGEVLMGIGPTPTRDRIDRECEDHCIDGGYFVGRCRSPYSGRRHTTLLSRMPAQSLEGSFCSQFSVRRTKRTNGSRLTRGAARPLSPR